MENSEHQISGRIIGTLSIEITPQENLRIFLSHAEEKSKLYPYRAYLRTIYPDGKPATYSLIATDITPLVTIQKAIQWHIERPEFPDLVSLAKFMGDELFNLAVGLLFVGFEDELLSDLHIVDMRDYQSPLNKFFRENNIDRNNFPLDELKLFVGKLQSNLQHISLLDVNAYLDANK